MIQVQAKTKERKLGRDKYRKFKKSTLQAVIDVLGIGSDSLVASNQTLLLISSSVVAHLLPPCLEKKLHVNRPPKIIIF